ncbi:MAG: hypothetical protein NW214_11560 [Pseudanabaenaceae cyanobacterium bins.39]|nr:hypothetical protein [Pseudanabaenaceae cyanobacterium bins.39]
MSISISLAIAQPLEAIFMQFFLGCLLVLNSTAVNCGKIAIE